MHTPITHPLTVMHIPKEEFFPRYMIYSLHVWMLLVRLRAEGRDGRRQMQMLYDQFTEQVTKMVQHAGVKVRFVWYVWCV